MHSPLEQYLAEVAARLDSLPPKRRAEELREVRQHLLDAVMVNQEFSQSEAEAARSAVEQFGAPEALGDNLAWTWRRERRRDRRDLWRVIIAGPMFLWGLLLVDDYHSSDLLRLVWPSCNVFFFHHMSICRLYVHGVILLAYGLTGVILGATAPKQAVRGAWLGLAFYECGYLIWLGRPLIAKLGAMPYYAEDIARVLTGVFCAWAVSRWQAGAGRRARQA